MLTDLIGLGRDVLYLVGIVCVLWGAFVVIGASSGHGNGPMGFVKGGVLVVLGVYLTGLASQL